jgi:hypothetical protein
VSDCRVGIAGIHGVVIKDVGVEHFRNMYRKGMGKDKRDGNERSAEDKEHNKEKIRRTRE